jgi:O-antigen/teichoic acid export membrane protein
LLRNTAVNGVAYAASALVTLALTPFLLRRLGTDEYGIWLLALSLTFSSGYLALADIGLPEAAVRFIAEARSVGDDDEVNRIASTTIAVFMALGLVIGAVIAALAPIFTHVFDVPSSLHHTAKVAFFLMSLEVVLELPVAALRAVIEGAQRYFILRAIDIAGRLLWGVLVVVVVVGGHGVVSLAVTLLITTVARAVATLVFARRAQPHLQLRPRFVTRATLRRTAGYGSLVGGLRLLSVIYSQMDRAIIGIIVGVTAVATYEVAFRVQSLATLALVMASSAVLPAAAYNAVRSDVAKQRELFLRGTKYAIALVVPVTVAAIIFARELIDTWVGSRFGDVTKATRLFLLFPLLASVNQVGVAMLLGLGEAKRVLRLQLVGVGTNLVLSLALAPHFGIEGVVTGTLVGGLVTWVPYVRLLLRTFEIDAVSWFRRVCSPNVPPVLAQVAFSLVLLHQLPAVHELWQVLLLYAASCSVSFVVFVFSGMTSRERRHVVSRFFGG